MTSTKTKSKSNAIAKTKRTRVGTKTTYVQVRVTQEQHEILMNLAHKRNLTFSEYLRNVLLQKTDNTHV